MSEEDFQNEFIFDPNQIDNTSYYNTLGIEKDASQSMIKKSYYKLARMYHPDKNQGYEDKVWRLIDIVLKKKRKI